MIERLTGWRALEWVGTVPPTVATTADTFGRERVDIVFGLDLRRPPIRSLVYRMRMAIWYAATSLFEYSTSTALAMRPLAKDGMRCAGRYPARP